MLSSDFIWRIGCYRGSAPTWPKAKALIATVTTAFAILISTRHRVADLRIVANSFDQDSCDVLASNDMKVAPCHIRVEVGSSRI